MTTATTLPGVSGPGPEQGPDPRRPSRWWIAAIPVAGALMLAASGYRVPVFWYQSGLHHEIASARPGQWAEVSETYTDARGEATRTYAVRFAGLGGADPAYPDFAGDDVTLPDGMVARVVNLDFTAAPDQPLAHCALTLIDDRGREYRVGGTFDDLGPRISTCVPEDTPGPSPAVLESDVRGATPEGTGTRPSSWSAAPAIAVPEDARFVELRVSFENPDYVTLTLPR